MKKGSKINRLPTGPTKETLKNIARAATLQVQGKTRQEIAKELGVSLAMVAEYRKVYAEWWQKAFDNALQQQIKFLEEVAGAEQAMLFANWYIDGRLPVVKRAEEQLAANDPPAVSADCTLTEFFRLYFKPVCLAQTGKLQTANYARTMRAWYVLTGDPPLKEITAGTLALFRDRVAKLPRAKALGYVTPTTVCGYLRWMQAVLDKAGPPMRGQRDAAGILDKVPWIKRPVPELKMPRTVSPELLSQLYTGLVAAEIPRIDGFKPPAWWRALIVVAYNTGLRRGTLLGLRMADIDWQRRTVLIRPTNNKSRKLFSVHLNETAYQHLLAIRTDREKVFPWPHDRRWFDVNFHRLQTAAGIPAADHFGLHNLRKTLATMLYEASPGAAQIALGHSDQRTTQTYYVAPSDIVARALDAIPQPDAFKGGEKGKGAA